jgi:hypothetical protein
VEAILDADHKIRVAGALDAEAIDDHLSYLCDSRRLQDEYTESWSPRLARGGLVGEPDADTVNQALGCEELVDRLSPELVAGASEVLEECVLQRLPGVT